MSFRIKKGRGSGSPKPKVHRFGQVRVKTGQSFGQNIGRLKIRFPRKVG